MKIAQTHERFTAVEQRRPSSDRSFGLTFSVFFFLVGTWPLLRGRHFRTWALVASAAMIIISMVGPAVLRMPNRAWILLADALHRVMSPIINLFIYFIAVTPVALVMRIVGTDPLSLKRDPSAATYWVERRPPGPCPKTMVDQF